MTRPADRLVFCVAVVGFVLLLGTDLLETEQWFDVDEPLATVPAEPSDLLRLNPVPPYRIEEGEFVPRAYHDDCAPPEAGSREIVVHVFSMGDHGHWEVFCHRQNIKRT